MRMKGQFLLKKVLLKKKYQFLCIKNSTFSTTIGDDDGSALECFIADGPY